MNSYEDDKLKKQTGCQNSVQEAITWRRAMTPVAPWPTHPDIIRIIGHNLINLTHSTKNQAEEEK